MKILIEKREFENEGINGYAVNVDSKDEAERVLGMSDMREVDIDDLVSIMESAAAADGDDAPMSEEDISREVNRAIDSAYSREYGSFSL